MNKKVFRPKIEFKEDDGEKGSFRAVFSTFNVIDLDGDVTLPGAFTEGQKVRIAYWGHRWHDLPVGRGVIGADEEKAWVDGKFFLDTQGGFETYKTVKNLAELQEWSYGFDIEESDRGVFEGEDVQFLKKMTVFEVSPVLLGAGIGTMTEGIKGQGAAGSAPTSNDNELNGTASEDADQNESPDRSASHDADTSPMCLDGTRLESEAGDPRNGDFAGNESGRNPETYQQLIDLEMEIDDEY